MNKDLRFYIPFLLIFEHFRPIMKKAYLKTGTLIQLEHAGIDRQSQRPAYICSVNNTHVYFHFFDSQDNNSFSAISSRSVNIHDASENLNNSCKKLLQAEEDAKNERIR